MRDLVKDWIQLFWKKTKDETSETCLCLHSEHESMEFLILIAFFSIKYCNIHTHSIYSTCTVILQSNMNLTCLLVVSVSSAVLI